MTWLTFKHAYYTTIHVNIEYTFCQSSNGSETFTSELLENIEEMST